MVTRTESSEPVRQQLVRVSLGGLSLLTLCLPGLGSKGLHVPPQIWPGLRTVLILYPHSMPPSTVIGNLWPGPGLY